MKASVREVVSDCFTPWLDQVFVIGVVAMMVFLAAGALLGVMLIKNRFQPRSTAVIVVLQLPLLLLITPISSLGNSFIPFLWATVIVVHHNMRRAEQRVGSPTAACRGSPSQPCPERAS